MRLYRVFPWVLRAAGDRAGHPLWIPPVQGAGRIDNPEHYGVLYASDSAAGAVAEAFGNHAIWTDQLLAGRPELPRSRTALAEIESDGSVLDLDDPAELQARSLRPSHVVSRDRERTQAWALAAFREKRWSGVRWWSRYDARWGSHGLWSLRGLRVTNVTPLGRNHPAMIAAATELCRPWRSIGPR